LTLGPTSRAMNRTTDRQKLATRISELLAD
jgi:hypothetical protein